MNADSRASRGAAFVLACALATSTIPSVTLAQTMAADELAVARENFKTGIELEKAGKYGEALAMFEATAQVKLTPQVRFHIALCNEKLGHWGVAIEAYEAAAKQAQTEGNAPEVLSAAPGLAQKLKADRPKLTITLADGQAPDSVSIDGKSVEGNSAKDYPLDPGAHVVLATKGGDELREEIKLAEKESKTLTLRFGGTAAETTDVPAFDHPAERPKDKPVEAPRTTNPRRTLGFAVGGFGVVSLALSGAFYLVRTNALNDLEQACTADLRCPASTKDTYDRANTFTVLSGVALGVGVAAIGVGTALILTSRPKTEEPKTAGIRVVPYAPNANLFGLGIDGSF